MSQVFPKNVFQLLPDGINGESLQPCEYINKDNITSGSADEKAQVFLISEDERFSVGVWESTPCCEEIESYAGDEFCTVLEGTVEITADGETHTYNVGDSFAIRKGTKLTWNMTNQFKKYFVMYC